MASKANYDVIILGGGPAGMSAAIWCADLNLLALLIEREEQLGGQLHRIFAPIKNYPGVPAKDGKELLDRFLGSMPKADLVLLLGENVSSIDLSRRRIEFENGEEVNGDAIIIATGVRRRKLAVDGEDEFVGRGMLTSGAREKESVKGAHVVIVGGGDAALENALILSDHAEKVTVVHRRNEFSARPDFVQAAEARSNVSFILSSTVQRFTGSERLEGVELKTIDGKASSLDVSYALVRIGVEPNTEMFDDQLRMDSNGYVVVTQNCETSCPDVYAIGDIAFPLAPTIATAVGTAATATKHIKLKFEKMHLHSTG